MATKSVPQALTDLGELYRQRNAMYGDNYKHTGMILAGIFPHGLRLTTPEQFNRFALFIQLLHKITRYGRAMPDNGHIDSLDDISVYAQMLQEYDAETSTDPEVRGG